MLVSFSLPQNPHFKETRVTKGLSICFALCYQVQSLGSVLQI